MEHDLDALAAFVEGRLDAGARGRLSQHLAACAECRTTLAAMTRAREQGALAGVAPHPERRGSWRAPAWTALAASVVIATFAWMQFAQSPQPPADGDLLTRRSAERIVEGRTFRLDGSVWTDRGYDPAANLTVVEVRGIDERTLLLMNTPALAPYADLGERVIVVWDGKVYRFEP